MQTTSHILMIRPVNFAFNEQTAVNNAFQVQSKHANIQQEAALEFDVFVQLLRSKGIDITVVDDTPDPHTPDSIFPNNWISFHEDGTVVLYPMFAKNRRLERKPEVVDKIRSRFEVARTIDLTNYESNNRFLEGTGSMVLDRENKMVYACISPRTDVGVLEEFCSRMQFKPVLFHAVDGNDLPIYHTNVMMCVADKYMVICLESIKDVEEKKRLIASIEQTGKEVIEISLTQMNHFAGNMLQVNDTKGKKYLVMSTQAFRSLNDQQKSRLETFNEIIHSSLNTIEENGGGSARCMMAEVHLSQRSA